MFSVNPSAFSAKYPILQEREMCDAYYELYANEFREIGQVYAGKSQVEVLNKVFKEQENA